jgi:UDP-glucose 4-epimerase
MDLVTGGAGFIGSHLVEALVRRGRSVRVLDNLSTGHVDHLGAVRDGIEFIDGDVLDPTAVSLAVRDVEVVYHQAAWRSVPLSIEHPNDTNRVNVEGTLNVLTAARDADVGRVIYASSSSVYGAARTLPLDEEATPRPVSPYAVSKLSGEHYCQVFTRVYGLETVSLRYFNVFGPRQSPDSAYAAVIPRFITAALSGASLEVHGDGLQSRDFTHVRDVVEANCLAAESTGVAGDVFNIASGRRNSLMDIIDWLRRRLSEEQKILSWHHVAPRAGDVRHTQAATEKAEEGLGYRAAVAFEDGLEDTFRSLAKLPVAEAGRRASTSATAAPATR